MPPPLTCILETVLYYDSGRKGETRRFYSETLGLDPVSGDRDAFRLGDGLLLLFDRKQSSVKLRPPPHGTQGSTHVCFTTTKGDYEAWKRHLDAHGVALIEEIEWRDDVRSFYFKDPAGNLLEISDGDMWPMSAPQDPTLSSGRAPREVEEREVDS